MPDLQEFLNQIKSNDANTRFKAWEEAGPMGAAAIAPLADLMKEDDRYVGKAAKMAAQNIVHHAGRPGAADEAKAVSAELLKVAQSRHTKMVRSDVLTYETRATSEDAASTRRGVSDHDGRLAGATGQGRASTASASRSTFA